MDNHDIFIPGTTIQIPYTMLPDISIVLSPILEASDGLMLSQVSVIGENLSNDTIQNWVKRGFVPSTINKRYLGPHVARILLLNLLRDSMQLEKNMELLEYFNGIGREIDECNLYVSLCKIILELEYRMTFNNELCNELINKEIDSYKNLNENQKAQFYNVLNIAILVFMGTSFKKRANQLLNKTINGRK